MLLLEYPIECRHGISSLSDFAKISAPPAAGNRHKWLNNQPFVTKMAMLRPPDGIGKRSAYHNVRKIQDNPPVRQNVGIGRKLYDF